MTDKLPENLLRLFTPRPPVRWVSSVDQPLEKRKTTQIDGIGAYLARAKEVDEKYKHLEQPTTESEAQKRDRIKAENRAKSEYMKAEGFKEACKCSLADRRNLHVELTISQSSLRKTRRSPAIPRRPCSSAALPTVPRKTTSRMLSLVGVVAKLRCVLLQIILSPID